MDLKYKEEQFTSQRETDRDSDSDKTQDDVQLKDASSLQRSLRVDFTNVIWSKAHIVDPASGDTLFEANFRVLNPLVIVKPSHLAGQAASSASDSSYTASYHLTSRRIDLVVGDRKVQLQSRGKFKEGYFYNSPAFGGQQLMWRASKRFSCLNVVCTDEKQNPVASMKVKKLGLSNAGAIDLTGAAAATGPVMDELVLTGLAVLQAKMIYWC